ncbi:MAG: DUF5320 family protein [Candidatus Omnitrophica bacterium]|nr:DUF5320 family protein [Candidatus Omnitrophota bacterium]
MSFLNGKGPQNEGPRTGRGLGNCSAETKDMNENEASAPLYGRGRGGRPRGCGNGHCGQKGFGRFGNKV